MNRKIRPAVVVIALMIGCVCARAQTKFNGQITPGVSTRSDVDKFLGEPVKQESATLFEYKPPTGAARLDIGYRADGVVFYVNAMFTQTYPRQTLVQAFGLPSQPQPTMIAQAHLDEFFGAPAYLVFTYATSQASSGVINLRYDSAEAFAGEAPGNVQHPPAAPPGNNAPPQVQPVVPAPPPSRPNAVPPASPVMSPPAASPAPAMWQRQQTVANQPWTVCAGVAPKALASAGFGVTAVNDPQGNLRLFYTKGNGKNSAVINCSWAGTTAVYVLTSASLLGISDAQNVTNQLYSYLFSPAPSNAASPLASQPAGSSTLGLEQRHQGVTNLSLASCADTARKALASQSYEVTASPDEQGAQTIFYGSGKSSNSAVIGCTGTSAMTLYTISVSSARGNADAMNSVNCLYNFVFPSATTKSPCNAPPPPSNNAPPQVQPVVPAPPTPSNTPAAQTTAPQGALSDVLRPLEANKSHIFVLRLLTPIDSTSTKAGDTIRAQVISSDPAQGSVVTGTIHGFACTSSGMLKCVVNLSLDFLIHNGQTIPIVANLSAGPGQSAIVNSKGWPHVDEEGNVVSQGGNYLDAITKLQVASMMNGKPIGPHPDVFIEMTANGPTLSFAAGSQFMVAMSSDLGRLKR